MGYGFCRIRASSTNAAMSAACVLHVSAACVHSDANVLHIRAFYGNICLILCTVYIFARLDEILVAYLLAFSEIYAFACICVEF